MNPEQEALLERQRIRELIENWALWRDAGDWARFASVWHDDGVMMATWFQGPAAEFIRVTQEGWAKGVSILHFLGGSSVDVNGQRAVAQTKMTISQRADVHGVACDVVCTGRFFDFLEVKLDMPQLMGAEVDALAARGKAWLAGDAVSEGACVALHGPELS